MIRIASAVLFSTLLVLMLSMSSGVSAQILSSAPPASGKQFALLTPGSSLPSDSQCASKLRHTTWEPRPENTDENHYIAVKNSDYSLLHYNGSDNGIYQPGHAAQANALVDRVTGNFTGTTDEILQWAACKWGFDEDMARAQAVTESYWNMSAVGDNGESFGILQVRKTAQVGTYPASVKSTAFNADYTYMRWRMCYEGLIDYLGESAQYGAGDAWGCVGVWFSGFFHTPPSETYIAAVKDNLNKREWESWQGTQISPVITAGATSTPPANSGCATRVNGDADCSGTIDITDFEIWRKEFTHQLNTTLTDYDSDGGVTVSDFEIWRRGYYNL